MIGYKKAAADLDRSLDPGYQRLDGHPFGRHPFGRHLVTQLRDDAKMSGAQMGACPAAEGGRTTTPLPATLLGVVSDLGPEMTPKGVAPKGVVVQPLREGSGSGFGLGPKGHENLHPIPFPTLPGIRHPIRIICETNTKPSPPPLLPSQ